MRHVLRIEEKIYVNTILMGKPEGKRQPRRPELRWEYNTKINLTEVAEPEVCSRFSD
jgi:hypothetical protein